MPPCTTLAGERFLVSRSTVKTHLNHAPSELDISSRAGLASALPRGLSR